MIRRNWRILIPIIPGLVAIAALGYQEIREAQVDPYPQAQHQPANYPSLPPAPKDEVVATGAYDPRCHEPKSAADSDLCAQWSAVKEVHDSNRIARASLWLTSFESLALVTSLFFTAWAALAASAAAKAADRAVAITEATAMQQLRAYVDVNEASLCWGGGEFMDITVICRNTGQTPAKFFEIWHSISTFSIDNIDKTIDRAALTLSGPWNALGGNSQLSARIIPPDVFSPNRTSITKELTSFIYFMGFIRYEDTFGDTYESEFTFHTPVRDVKMPDANRKMSRSAAKLRVYEKVES